LDDIEHVRSHVDRYSELAELAFSASDIRSIHKSGKRAVVLSIESRDSLEGRTDLLHDYYQSGVRSITLLHSQTDPIAETKDSRPGNSGLSAFGFEVVAEMNRLGILIDITHCPDRLQQGLIAASKAPVVASHSCVRALNNTPRNIPDEILLQLAEKGGAVMIAFGSAHPGGVPANHLSLAKTGIQGA